MSSPYCEPDTAEANGCEVAPYRWRELKKVTFLIRYGHSQDIPGFTIFYHLLHDLLHSAGKKSVRSQATWPVPLAPAQTMSGVWGEGRAECAQAVKSLRLLKRLRHVETC